MSGEELKKKLRSFGVNLSKLSADLGYDCDQRLHSNLKAEDVKSGLLENIAKALNRSILDFYDEECHSQKSDKTLESLVMKQQKVIETQQGTIDRLTKMLEQFSLTNQ